MKKKLLFFLLFFAGVQCLRAQELPNLKHVKLNKKVHFKETEQLILKVVTYLFETPISKKNKSRAEAGQFLLNWMNGTPDFTFYLEDKETSFFNTDSDLILMYMAALTKFTLENRTIKDQQSIILGTMRIVLPYLNQQEDKKSWSALLWQLNDANQKGKLLDFLDKN